SAREALAAVSALHGRDDPLARDALSAALAGPHPSARLAAAQALRPHAPHCTAPLTHALAHDPSSLLPPAALQAPPAPPPPPPPPARGGGPAPPPPPPGPAPPPLTRVPPRGGGAGRAPPEPAPRLAPGGHGRPACGTPDPRARGVRDYLRYRWSGQ